jgi:RHS repeat-associated protein
MGYGGADTTKQKFTGKERDTETGLDYFGARYYSSAQGRFTTYDPLFVTAKRLIDPQRFNQYAYTRNNPLRFIDPEGLDVTITAKNEEEALKRYKIFLLSLRPEDRQHVHFFTGDGKNGYAKGQYYILVDKDYKSDSGNFQAIQTAANDRNDVGRITVVMPGDTIAVRNAELNNGKITLVAGSFKFDNEFDGYTFFQYRGKDEPVAFSNGEYTEEFVKGNQDDIELAVTMIHELRAHMVLGDFGRNVPKASHSDEYTRHPGSATAKTEADKVAEAAESEARENAKKH